MKCIIVTPAASDSNKGNRITALRWEKMIRGQGHQVAITEKFENQTADLLIALHARKSYPSIKRFKKILPENPIILTMTGTDLYQDYPKSKRVLESLQLATRIVVLQDHAVSQLPKSLHKKIRVIYQSSEQISGKVSPLKRVFEVSVVGHLRAVKDPFLTAKAAAMLPKPSKVQVIHIGKALTASMASSAKKLQQTNPRYQWLGELSPAKTRQRVARSRLTVVSSKMEGGANVISEAVVRDVPVLATKMSGNIGMLGDDYPGFFPVGDVKALANLLERAETDTAFYKQICTATEKRKKLFKPKLENDQLQRLLKEVM